MGISYHLHHTVNSAVLSLVFSCSPCIFPYFQGIGWFVYPQGFTLVPLATARLLMDIHAVLKTRTRTGVFYRDQLIRSWMKWLSVLANIWLILREFPLSPCLIYLTFIWFVRKIMSQINTAVRKPLLKKMACQVFMVDLQWGKLWKVLLPAADHLPLWTL